MKLFLLVFKKLRKRNVQIIVNTRCPDEHGGEYIYQAFEAVMAMQALGVRVFYTVKLHRKIAIIDDDILWEGSLNILSQNDSYELMRRSVSQQLVKQMTGLIS